MQVILVQVGPIGTNCYIVCDEKAGICVVIDPGAEAEKIIASMYHGDKQYQPAAILLTHGHYDHTDGVAGLRDEFPDIPVYLNQRDVYADRGAAYRQLFPVVPNTTNYDEGDVLHFSDELEFHVLATPGHTEGSVTLQCNEILFSGDTLFKFSCGRTDFVGSDPQKMLLSLLRLAKLDTPAAGDWTIAPGHMELSTMLQELQHNPYIAQALEWEDRQ